MEAELLLLVSMVAHPSALGGRSGREVGEESPDSIGQSAG